MLRFLLLLLVILPANVYGRQELALNKPIVEGASIAGVKIGDPEAEIFEALGFPDLMESNFLREPHKSQQGLKFLLYGLDKENLITIYTKYGKVEAIHLFWVGAGQATPPAYKGKTTKGIGLGDKVEDVRRYYAGCKMSAEDSSQGWLCWDKDSGISIGADNVNVIRLIGIVAPGKELPEYLKPENQRF